MAEVIIYTSGHCPYCTSAKQLLDRKGVPYSEIRIDQDTEKREEMIQKTNRYTVPQIFINGKPIGGCDDMYALDRAGRLDELLRGNTPNE